MASSRAIDEALWRHDVARDTADFTAQYNLGAILQLRGQPVRRFRTIKPLSLFGPLTPSPTTPLAVFCLPGQSRQAIAPLQAAIQSRPDDFASYYNLGNANATLHQFPQAISHFRKAVQPNPEDSMAEANLGAALAEIGELASAKTHWERALKLDPQNQLAQDDLQEVRRRLSAPSKPSTKK